MEDKITMRAARVNAGLTQRNIADAMHVSPNTVHFWETGKVIPKPAQFEMYSRLCGRSSDRIILPKKVTRS